MVRVMRPRVFAFGALLSLIGASAGPLTAQPATSASKKVLTFADYDIWKTASGVSLSRDGQYVAYLVGGKDFGEAVVRHIATGKEFRFPRGTPTVLPNGSVAYGSPRFTPDSRRVLLPLTPTQAAINQAKAEKRKLDDYPKAALAIVDLATGTEIERLEGFTSFQVGGTGAGFVIYRRGPPPETDKEKDAKSLPTPGAIGTKKGASPEAPAARAPGDLLIRDLTATFSRTIPDVSEYTLSDDEKTLVYIVSSKNDEKNGVYALNPRFNTAATPVKVGPGRYSGLTWDEKQTQLAFFYDDSTVPPANLAPPPHLPGQKPGSGISSSTPTTPKAPERWQLFVWQRDTNPTPAGRPRIPAGISNAGWAALVAPVVAATAEAPPPVVRVCGPDTPGLKPGWALRTGGLSFSRDGRRLFVATAPDRTPATVTTTTPDFQLDIWHWKDELIQPMQKVRAEEERRSGRSRTYNAVIHLDTKEFRHLSNEQLTVEAPSVGDWAIAADDSKYRFMTGYAYPVPNDYSLVNIRTGAIKPLLTAAEHGLTLSPTGQYLLGFDGQNWFTISVPDAKKTNLTAHLGVKFFNEHHDMPSPPSAYGSAGWSSDGRFVLLRDRYDIWKIAADGSCAENLTKIGRTQNIRFTIVQPRSVEERTKERGIDLKQPLLLAAVNLTTYDTGFYRLEPGGTPKLLLMGARAYGTPVKAHQAEVYLLTVQTFTQYPDYYVTTPDFHELKRVTDINPHIRNYNWGRAELITYTSLDGDKLAGILIKPENFNPQKKYPLIVYIYERLSENLHQFRIPDVTRGQVINPTFYASNGYLVLMPDIAYKVGAPGPSALKCVLPAVQAVVDKGCVDENAIGINGQSWGGYQIAYMITQTNRFKAAVAGAPVANMFSAYDGIRWGTGLPRQFQYERSQSRIGATPWEAPLRFLENSPIFAADRVQTPLLMIHNDQDDAVPWYQGIEYYLALRRLGKEVYLLNYNGQPHNLTNKNAARDFSVRMFQFFEHHLKGQPAPQWMAKGVPYSERDQEREQLKKLYSQP
ncbi:MAG: prolyl oligopeptidase family serine peptidase [Gemmataceae bacterium]|nr:prolyl oligopeptidase family serine peptidase [Gemmata sp.]MDW8198440.1 prolyl oligopeptidase family serine peptidase [Gemmataceae bacterium]